MDFITLALCKKLVAGAVSGIASLEVNGTTLIITTKDGQKVDMVFPTPEDGLSVSNMYVNEKKELICILSDGTEINAGEVPVYIPQKGVDYLTQEEIDTIKQEVAEEIEITDNAITTAKIADANVTKAKLSVEVQASLDKAANTLADAKAYTDSALTLGTIDGGNVSA